MITLIGLDPEMDGEDTAFTASLALMLEAIPSISPTQHGIGQPQGAPFKSK